MPPKRGKKAPMTPSRQTYRTRSLGFEAERGSTRTALPVKHSSSYGSAMPDLPSPSIMRSGNLKAALKEVHENQKKALERKRAEQIGQTEPGIPPGDNTNPGQTANNRAAAQAAQASSQPSQQNMKTSGNHAPTAPGSNTKVPPAQPENKSQGNSSQGNSNGTTGPSNNPPSQNTGTAPAQSSRRKRNQRDPQSDEDAQAEKAARDTQVQKEQQQKAEQRRQAKEAEAAKQSQVTLGGPATQTSGETPEEAAARRAQDLEDGWPHRARRIGLINQEQFEEMIEEARAKRAAEIGDKGKGAQQPQQLVDAIQADGNAAQSILEENARLRKELEREQQNHRLGKGPSEPPMSSRSFVEESAIFGRAKVDSPLAARFAEAAARGGHAGRGRRARGNGRGTRSRLQDQIEDESESSLLEELDTDREPRSEDDVEPRDSPPLQPPLHLDKDPNHQNFRQVSLFGERGRRERSHKQPAGRRAPVDNPQGQPAEGTQYDEDETWNDRLGSYAQKLWLLAGMLLRNLAFWAAVLAIFLVLGRATTSSFPVRWYGWNDLHHNLGQFVPGSLFPPLGNLSTSQFSEISNSLWDQSLQLAGLQKDLHATDATVKKLDGILPDLLHVKKDGRTGKLVIDAEFWHALKDYIQKDKDIVSLDAKSKDITDQQWKVLQARLEKSALTGIANSKEMSTKMEGVVKKTLPNMLEEWFKENHKKVNALLSKSSPQLGELPLKIEQKLLSKTEKLVDEKLSSNQLTDKVVTKKEFVNSLKENLASQKADWEEQFAELKTELTALIEKARSIEGSPAPAGLSRDDVKSIVKDIVEKAISNARLEAAARSQIATHFDQTLRHQVNYFASGNGATVNSQLSSPSWDPRSRSSFSEVWGKVTNKLPRFQPERGAALTGWTDAGHCWCADSSFRPAELVVQLRDTIIPQHLVVEHIDPTATLDGGATPKQIEVWAAIDRDRLSLARNFQAAHFPGTNQNDPLAAKQFVKIGEFEYKHSRKDGGVQVYPFSKTLAEIRAASDHIVVRAKTNYGSTDHTCFYRVRLYGEPYQYEINR